MNNPRRKWIAAVTLCVAAVPNLAAAAPISGQGTWETTLQGRDLDGNPLTYEAYYDTVLDITWLANARLAGTDMDWASANAWVAALDINGITGWRLPTVTPINGSSFNTAFSNNATTDVGFAGADGWVDGMGNPVSEMGHMFYVTLGNLGQCTPSDSSPGSCGAGTTQTGWGLSNTGPFSNIVPRYWTDIELNADPAWEFSFGDGMQLNINLGGTSSAWAVRSGDISAVPVPAAIWLFGSGLMGLMGLARRDAGIE